MLDDTQAQIAQARTGLIRRAALVSVSVAIVLIIVKGWATWQTGSVSLLASLVDSFLDSIASIFSALAVGYSLTPPDTEHRFGHGKAQALAGLMQAFIIVGSAIFLVLRAIERFSDPQPLEAVPIGIGVMLFSMAVTAGLVVFQRYVVRQTEAVAIKADSAHYFSDFLANIVVVVALIAGSFGWVLVDPILALAIAAWIVWSAFDVAGHSVQELMDRELDKKIQDRILAAAGGVDGVHDVHDLRTRRAGHVDIIQMHIALDDSLKLRAAHDIADEVVAAVREVRPGADVTIHQDPLSVVDADTTRW